MTKQISSKIKVLNILMMIIIVAYHTEIRGMYNSLDEIIYVANAYFFMVSAYFFFSKFEEYGFKKLIARRARTLLIPFFVWNLIYFLRLLVLLGWDYLNLNSIVSAFFLSPLCLPSWYLEILFLFFLMGYGIHRVLGLRFGAVILIVASLLIAVGGEWGLWTLLHVNVRVAGVLVRAGYYLPAFIAGAVVGQKKSITLSIGNWKNLAVMVIAAGLLMLLVKTDMPMSLRLVIYNVYPVIIWISLPDAMFGRVKVLDMFARPLLFVNMSHNMLFYYAGVIPFIHDGTFSGAIIKMILAFAVGSFLYYLIYFICPKLLILFSGNR